MKKINLIICAIIMISLSSSAMAHNSSPVSGKAVTHKIEANGVTLTAATNPAADLEKAKKEGKSVFLVITGTGAIGVDKVVTVAKAANAKVIKSVVVQMNKDDATNSALVSKLGVSGVQVPLILVISPKGVAVAGFNATQATTELLVQAIPSPKQDEVLFAISQKKPVFMVVSKKGLTDKTTMIANCTAASAKIASKPTIVEFDFSDPKEAAFLKQLGITAITTKTLTVVINASGQISDRFEGIALEAALMASATKVVKSGGCAPSACGGKSSCSPSATPANCGTKK